MAPCRALQVPSSFEVPSNTLGQPDDQQREDLGYSCICGTSHSCRRSLRHRFRWIAVGADLLFEQPHEWHVPFLPGDSKCFWATFYVLASLQKQGKQLVLDINQRESLSLDAVHLLGFPCPAFVVFDRRQRRIPVCNSSTRVLEILA